MYVGAWSIVVVYNNYSSFFFHTAMSDFGNVNFVVEINNTQPSVNLSIPIMDDSLFEGNESFFLTISAIEDTLVHMSDITYPSQAEIIIQDGDGNEVYVQSV